ncbi:hypothetical protein RUND412_009602 [Rhizina undulata]
MYSAAGGQQLDLNHLWQQIQELSTLLAQNRESAAGLVQKADAIRAAQNRGEQNLPGEEHLRVISEKLNGDGCENAAVPCAHDEEEIQKLRLENTHLRADNEDLMQTIQDYEAVLEKVIEGVRIYAHEQSVSTINIHQNYTQQLANERQANAMLRQNEAESQARLAEISRMLREVYEDQNSIETDALIDNLKMENEALKEALGLPINSKTQEKRSSG